MPLDLQLHEAFEYFARTMGGEFAAVHFTTQHRDDFEVQTRVRMKAVGWR